MKMKLSIYLALLFWRAQVSLEAHILLQSIMQLWKRETKSRARLATDIKILWR